MIKEGCLTYFFGMCVTSENEAYNFVVAWTVGTALGLGIVLASLIFALLEERRNKKVKNQITT